MLTEKEIQSYEDKLSALNLQIEKREEDKEILYCDNKEKVDLRSVFAKKAGAFLTLAIISLVVAIIGIFINYIITGISGAAFIVFLVLRSKPAKSEKELSSELAAYDNNVKKLDGEIAKIKNEMELINAVLERNRYLEQFSVYEKNHICIYVGQSDSGMLKEKPQETASRYDSVDQVKVFIDGIEYGDISEPFGAFEVTPGPHVVKIECMTQYGSKVIRTVTSKAQQVKISDGSVFIFYHWNFYWKNSYLCDALFLKTYDNVYDFLVDTHQIKK